MSTQEKIPKDYSVVVPVYYNEGTLTKTMDSLKEYVIDRNREMTCEVIFIDDGSGDDSLNELLRLREKYPDLVKVIKLTRNFGQVNAMTAGFRKASGRCVVAISADGQDPVELINQMLDEFRAGSEIVVATREDRDESMFRIWTSRIFYELMRKMSFPNMPSGGFDFFLLGRRPLDAILHNCDAHPFLQGQILWTGFPVKFLHYIRRQREIGKSRWSFGKKLTYLLDGVMSYSFIPIRLMSVAGGLVAISGFIYALVVLFDRVFWGNPVKGWAPIMIVLLVVSGIQLLMLGIIGEYLWRTLAQVRQRAPYLIDSIYE
jgi:dolichol-phosphate mannosyltransferase